MWFLALGLGGLKLRDDALDLRNRVGLAVTECVEVRLQRVTGHLELAVREMDRVHLSKVGRRRGRAGGIETKGRALG